MFKDFVGRRVQKYVGGRLSEKWAKLKHDILSDPKGFIDRLVEKWTAEEQAPPAQNSVPNHNTPSATQQDDDDCVTVAALAIENIGKALNTSGGRELMKGVAGIYANHWRNHTEFGQNLEKEGMKLLKEFMSAVPADTSDNTQAVEDKAVTTITIEQPHETTVQQETPISQPVTVYARSGNNTQYR